MHAHYSLHAAGRGGSGYGERSTSVLDEIDITGATRTAACVLFTGGVEARSLAERIHRESGWGWGPFTAIDCRSPQAVLDESLFDPLESDLWPVDSSVPILRLLQPGTMFLEEVGRLGRGSQARLRDLLELAANERQGRRSRRRIMASSSESLVRRAADGTFDETLFYRLNALHFVL